MPRARAIKNELKAWDDAPLPKLPELYCGIFVREGGNRQAVDELADHLSELRFEHLPDDLGSPELSTPLHASGVR